MPVKQDPARQSQELFEVAVQAWRNRGKTVNARTLSMAALGLTDKEGQPFLTALEQRHPAQTLLLNQLARPLVEAIIPSELAREAEAVFATGEAQSKAQAEAEAEIQALKERLQALQDELKRSQEQLDQFIRRMKKES